MNQALKINGCNNWNMKSSKVQNVFVQQEVKRIINFVIKLWVKCILFASTLQHSIGKISFQIKSQNEKLLIWFCYCNISKSFAKLLYCQHEIRCKTPAKCFRLHSGTQSQQFRELLLQRWNLLQL